MNTRLFRAMNTEWWIGTAHHSGQHFDLAPMEAAVHAAEAHFSRFLPDSALSRLNRERALADRALASIVGHALAMHEATDGAFDVRVGAALNAAGYDRTFDTIRDTTHGIQSTAPVLTFTPPMTALRVHVEDDLVRMDGTGTIDLGGIAKGWTVDRVAEQIEGAGCHDYLVDGGGDIRAAGRDERGEPWAVGIGEGLAIRLTDAAVCTSSTRRRRWRAAGEDAHHIIDPATGAPSRHAVSEAVVIAQDATLADVLATTVIADPEHGLAAVIAMRADALILRHGEWEMTTGMQRWLI